jgi:hypothetical protein
MWGLKPLSFLGSFCQKHRMKRRAGTEHRVHVVSIHLSGAQPWWRGFERRNKQV